MYSNAQSHEEKKCTSSCACTSPACCELPDEQLNNALVAAERENEVVSAVLSGDIDYVACLSLVAAAAKTKSQQELATAKLEQVEV